MFNFNFKATLLYDENNFPKELTNKQDSNPLFVDSSKITGEAEKLTGTSDTRILKC